MLNGSGLNPSNYTADNVYLGLFLEQACLIIPFPDDSTKYYLIHNTIDYAGVYSLYFYFTLIDMTLDNGLRGVVSKNNILLNDTTIPGSLTACKHANGRDWWLINHEQGTNRYFKFLITPYGISGPFSQYIGKVSIYSSHGQVAFSPDGTKFANYDVYDDLDIMDFDRCSGNFSNCIHVAIDDSAGPAGVAFSPNSKVLYVSSTRYVYQYDLTSANIPSTQITVAVWDGFYSPVPPYATSFSLAQLAPDRKIYIATGSSTEDIHVINYPDSLGLACNVCQHCIHLPTIIGTTVPNFPNYFLGADTNSTICDTLRLGIDNAEFTMQNDVNVFPNPVSGILYATLHVSLKIISVKVFNAFGQEMAVNYSIIKSGEYLELNTASLSQGVYFLELLSVKEKVVKKFVKE